MDKVLQECAFHRDRCYELAETAPTVEIRARLIKIARLYEKEIQLVLTSQWCISASNELIARVNETLASKTDYAALREAPHSSMFGDTDLKYAN